MTVVKLIAGLTVIALAFLSLWWTTRKARGILRKSLGRSIRDGEEMSLKSWMEVSDENLDSAGMALKRDPFDRALKSLLGDQAMAVGPDEIIRMRPSLDPSSPSVLWNVSRDGKLAFCEARFVPNGVEISVMQNGTRVFSRTFSSSNEALNEAADERKRMLRAGWQEVKDPSA